MAGGKGAPYRAPCGGWANALRGILFGCGGSMIVRAHQAIPRLKNTTLISTAPCDPEELVAAQQRQANPGPATPETPECIEGVPRGALPDTPNTYAAPPEGEDQTVDLSLCFKTGFKNVFAAKQWHGMHGFTSVNGQPRIRFMKGDLSGCRSYDMARNNPDPNKYLRLRITAKHKVAYSGSQSPLPAGSESNFSSTCTIDRLSGKPYGSSTGIADEFIADLLGEFNDVSHDKVASLYGEWATSWLSLPGVTTGDNPTSFNYHHEADGNSEDAHGSATFGDEAAFNYHHATSGLTVYGTTQEDIEDISLTISNTVANFVHTKFVTNDPDPAGSLFTTETWQFKAELFMPYTWSQLRQDLVDLLAVWNLGDDAVYPWRDTQAQATSVIGTTNGISEACVTGGPLVTRNERNVRIPFRIDNADWEDSEAGPPRTTIADGGIVGGPLPAGYEPFFDALQVQYAHAESMSQGIVRQPAYYGAFSPIRHATQWINNDEVRHLPFGPFVCCGALKNPERFRAADGAPISSSINGLGVIMCKYAETKIVFPSHDFFRPCGADRATWPDDAWPICGRIAVSSATQSGGNVDIVLAEAAADLETGDEVDFTGVGGLGAGLTITVTDSTHFSVPGTLSGAYVSGGYVSSAGAPAYAWHDTQTKGDFIYKVWQNDFRDFLESYRVRKMAAGSIGEVCESPFIDPVRYLAVTPDSLEFNEIGTGSYWLKELKVTQHCLRYSPCAPAVIYVSPNEETGHANSIALPMPDLDGDGLPIVGDSLYGSLWLGRIQQPMVDPLSVVAWEEAVKEPPTRDKSTEEGGGTETAPDLPAAATPLGCPDYVANLNADPQVATGGECEPPYTFSIQYDLASNDYFIFGQPNPVVLPWVL